MNISHEMNDGITLIKVERTLAITALPGWKLHTFELPSNEFETPGGHRFREHDLDAEPSIVTVMAETVTEPVLGWAFHEFNTGFGSLIPITLAGPLRRDRFVAAGVESPHGDVRDVPVGPPDMYPRNYHAWQDSVVERWRWSQDQARRRGFTKNLSPLLF